MNTTEEKVRGTLKPDGSLELEHKPALPPGPVEVTIQVLTPNKKPVEGWADYFYEELLRKYPERLKQAKAPDRTAEEIDADFRESRRQDEERSKKIEDLQSSLE